MTQKRTSRIDRIGAPTGQYFNRNLDWFFSDNIEDWIHSKRRTANKRIVEWERNRRKALKNTVKVTILAIMIQIQGTVSSGCEAVEKAV